MDCERWISGEEGEDVTENACDFVGDGVQVSGVEKFLSLAEGLKSVLPTPRAQRCRGLK